MSKPNRRPEASGRHHLDDDPTIPIRHQRRLGLRMDALPIGTPIGFTL
ncbi:hypothetical protein [Caulobacter sp.]